MYYASNMIILVALMASVAAFAGGAIALRFRDKLHIILGLSAGAVIGAALFDLIPESIELASGLYTPGQMTALTASGFFLYLILDRVFSFHEHTDEDAVDMSNHNDVHLVEKSKGSDKRGSFGAASFCLHSLIDGIAIGLSFKIGDAVGYIVAIAVVAHRFSDGINTIGVILKHHGKNKQAWGWLIAVAVSPVLGAALTFYITVKDQYLAIILSVFAGFFLYIGASDLIPEGKHSHSKIFTTVMTLVGALILYLIVFIAHS